MKRYQCLVDCMGAEEFHEHPEGEWVRYEDVQKQLDVWGTVHGHNVKLVAERAELRAELDRLRAELAEVKALAAQHIEASDRDIAAANALLGETYRALRLKGTRLGAKFDTHLDTQPPTAAVCPHITVIDTMPAICSACGAEIE